MPIITNNPAVAGASGMLGNNFVYRRLAGDRLCMANRPKKRKGGLSARQDVVVDRFSDATYYAKNKTAIPEFKALYRKGINKNEGINSAYNVAINDYLKPPQIAGIDAKDYTGEAGQLIRVRATDDFMVESVTVIIVSAEDEVIEQGEAVARGKKGLWRYATTVRNVNLKGRYVVAIAKDMPGNRTYRLLNIL